MLEIFRGEVYSFKYFQKLPKRLAKGSAHVIFTQKNHFYNE